MKASHNDILRMPFTPNSRRIASARDAGTSSILSVEKFGRIRESSILDGCVNLFSDGRIFLGCIIGITALLLPPLKMFGLICIGIAAESGAWQQRFARVLTLIGRWGFLDLFVAGVLVAWIQLNSLIRFEPRIGMIFFGLSVLLSYLASLCFDKARPEAES
jgi:paraquat-inducible protein A